jgi:glycosyltransferase involved in cell wall biosynthesis
MQVEHYAKHRPAVYLMGMPGRLGGAATKLVHLIRLLHEHFSLTLLASEMWILKDKEVRHVLEPFKLPCCLLKNLPKRIDGVCLAMCEPNFFISGNALELRNRGMKVVWSNEMMFPFKGEAEAARQGLIDRVLFASEFQARTFEHMYSGVPSLTTGNYVDPEDYSWRERRNTIFTLGRLSRPDLFKYPLDFPVFYEEIGLKEVRYRIMAWSPELQKQYRWHRFGPEWELLPANKQSALSFLYSLDVFLYPLGHRVKESWGRAVVEAMLTGAVPVVPIGHQFDKLMVPGESGFICKEFREFKAVMRELYENYPLRMKISRQAAAYAREHLCNPEEHRKKWIEALTF